MRLCLRRGTVVSLVPGGDDRRAALEVKVGGERRPAVSYGALTGAVQVGDEVIVNTQARDLGLGSGGFDVVHANLTRGLDGTGERGAHVMKLNYSSLQHAVHPVEERAPAVSPPLARPVAVLAVHGQLGPVAWAAARAVPGARIGYLQTGGGSLQGAHSRVLDELRGRGLIAGHVTAGPAVGGDEEAISVCGGLHAGLTELGWDACVAGPGPGIVGSGSELGHGGLAALDTAHAALALGCRTLLVPRMSSGDPRPRHRGLSHHTATVLDLLLRPVAVAVPHGEERAIADRHERIAGEADLGGYRSSGLPARTMGRSIDEDELFFRAALAGGSVLGREIRGL